MCKKKKRGKKRSFFSFPCKCHFTSTPPGGQLPLCLHLDLSQVFYFLMEKVLCVFLQLPVWMGRCFVTFCSEGHPPTHCQLAAVLGRNVQKANREFGDGGLGRFSSSSQQQQQQRDQLSWWECSECRGHREAHMMPVKDQRNRVWTPFNLHQRKHF